MTKDELDVHASKKIHDALISAIRAGVPDDQIAKALHDLATGKHHPQETEGTPCQ